MDPAAPDAEDAQDAQDAQDSPHRSVLLDEVLEALVRPDAGWLLDGTLGAGGHAAALLEACPGARLLGLDRDPRALELAGARLAPFGERALLARAAFDEAAEVSARLGAGPFHGALLDLGVSSMQLDEGPRGFSFRQDAPLDMRMDPDGPLTAATLVNELPEGELADLIYQLGEDRLSRRIARAVVAARPLSTTLELARVIEAAVPAQRRGPRPRRGRPAPRIHPATRTFQALRLAVNDELGQLDRALPALFELLAPGGRLAVISFHSLEDRRVKLFFRALKEQGRCRVLTKKPLRPTDAEAASNPRARSAKMRVAERLG